MNDRGASTFSNCLKSICGTHVQHKKLLFVIVFLLLLYMTTGKYERNNSFDYFIFSQRWLLTACIEYKEKKFSPAHFCVLPKNFEIWAIHGLWPTQENHMGPFFCNKSMPFDVNKLSTIESELTSNWPNIEGGRDIASLWLHEWEKHGTCAAQLESLNSEIKYFSTTLNIFKRYNVQKVFLKNNILSNSHIGVSVLDMFYAIKNSFGKLPQIHCIKEVNTNQPYVSEIRLCFGKNLQLMDCPDIHNIFDNKFGWTNKLTNCPTNRKVMYPDMIDQRENIKYWLESPFRKDQYDNWVDILRIIRFFQWASI